MQDTSIYQRWQMQALVRAMRSHRIAMLTGARQCGKTTLARAFAAEGAEYFSLDRFEHLESAQLDPQMFVRHTGDTMIIDEVQRVPRLLVAIKQVVDEDLRKGQYLLTGSANIWSMPTVNESLAGRIASVRLRTLSHGEVLGADPIFLERAFAQDFTYGFAAYDRDELLSIAMTGGYPEAMLLDAEERKSWHRQYIKALLDRDLKDVANIHRLEQMRDLVLILAGWSSKLMDKHAICASLGIRRETLDAYINALSTLYLCEEVPAWHQTDYDRVGKRSKLFFNDCGMMASLLDWQQADIKHQSDSLGKLFETFAMNELAIQCDVHEDKYQMYHYRDREKREIDFLIQRRDRALLGLEVKASSVVNATDFKHLKWFQQHLSRDHPFVGIVLYTGSHPLPFGPGMWAVPFSMLWPKGRD